MPDDTGSVNQPHDKSLRGHASQFFVAGELCRRGVVAVVTLGNCPNTDILCSDRAGTRFAHIQVKTFVPGKSRTCTVGRQAEHDHGASFFWVLAGIPDSASDRPFVYYVIPSAVMAEKVRGGHQRWLLGFSATGQPHKDSGVRIVPLPPGDNADCWGIQQYKNRWDLILSRLQAADSAVGGGDLDAELR